MDGETPLHYTAKGDSVDVARLLINRGAKVDAQDRLGNTHLHQAASRKKLKVTRLLIDNGANKNIKNNEGNKPIYFARSSEMKALLSGQDRSELTLDAQLNITGRDINQRHEENQMTALHIAAEKDLLEAAKWLIADKQGGQPGGKGHGWGDPSPLHGQGGFS